MHTHAHIAAVTRAPTQPRDILFKVALILPDMLTVYCPNVVWYISRSDVSTYPGMNSSITRPLFRSDTRIRPVDNARSLPLIQRAERFSDSEHSIARSHTCRYESLTLSHHWLCLFVLAHTKP